ncbi:hypothetical protein AGMMS49949_00580 [Alphaproteobacteria bacterium]|nr:hypothetical protein AGMMS49949_00580 [Alphaproteobacteria bacterium]GHS95598.1 hypothetical protein AGMMS50296_0220 [Alphaproteobacteria bacterium]
MNGKKIIAALGLLGVLATPKIQASLAAKEFDIVNGLLGMNRDIVMRLMQFTWRKEETRAVTGVSQETYRMTKTNAFVWFSNIVKERADLGEDDYKPPQQLLALMKGKGWCELNFYADESSDNMEPTDNDRFVSLIEIYRASAPGNQTLTNKD